LSALRWVEKAEKDIESARHLLGLGSHLADVACFHAQQAVEKLLKAFLVSRGAEITKTHNIARLIERCREIDPEFERLYDMEADRLTEYAVEARYPEFEEEPSAEEAEEAVKIAEKVREFVVKKIECGEATSSRTSE